MRDTIEIVRSHEKSLKKSEIELFAKKEETKSKHFSFNLQILLIIPRRDDHTRLTKIT